MKIHAAFRVWLWTTTFALACVCSTAFADDHEVPPVTSQLNTIPFTPLVVVRAAKRQKTSAVLCAISFTDDHPGSLAFRSRFRLPSASTPWTLFSIAQCHGEQVDKGPNSSSAIVFDGVESSRTLSVLRNPNLTCPSLPKIEGYACGKQNAATLENLLTELGDPKVSLHQLFYNSAVSDARELGEFWTAKTTAPSATELLLYEAVDEAHCDLGFERTAVISDFGMTDAMSAKLQYPDKSVAPKPSDAASFMTSAQQHIARIEFVTVSKLGAEVLEYCTGLVLDPSTLMTAGHCARLLRNGCASPLDKCGSYSADIFYRRPSKETPYPYVSIPIRAGFTKYELPASTLDYELKQSGRNKEPQQAARLAREAKDFAWLTLEASPGFNPPSLPLPQDLAMTESRLSQVNRDVPIEAVVLSHPAGQFLQLSDHCWVIGPYGPYFLHSCFTAGGSSGAPIWVQGDAWVAPVALHVRAARHCVAPVTWEPDVPAVVQNKANDADAQCVGEAITFHEIFCTYCSAGVELDARIHQPACEKLMSLLPEKLRTCEH